MPSNDRLIAFNELCNKMRNRNKTRTQHITRNEFRDIHDAVTAHLEYERNHPRRLRTVFDYAQDRNAMGNVSNRVDYIRSNLNAPYPYRRTNRFANNLQRFLRDETPQQPIIATIIENGHNIEDEIIMSNITNRYVRDQSAYYNYVSPSGQTAIHPNSIQQADEIWNGVTAELGWTYYPSERDPIVINWHSVPRGQFRSMSIYKNANAKYYTEYKQPTSSSNMDDANDTNICSICLEPMCDFANCVTTNNCFHTFHKNCLDKWLNDRNNTCPMCRTNIRKN